MRKLLWLIAVTAIVSIASCSRLTHGDAMSHNSAIPDTLRVGTLYSPTSFFLFRGDTMGYEYDRICSFAQSKGVATEFIIASNLQSLITMLDSGAIDVIAYEVPITSEYRKQVLNCGSENITYQVLVQPKSDTLITDVIQLINKDVYVEHKSKYEARLRNLDEEIGGGIRIHSLDEDTITSEDLIERVAKGKIPLTIVNSDIALINQTYYRNINIDLQVSFPQRASWAVRKDNQALADSISAWSELAESGTADKQMLRRYFEMSKSGASPAGLSDAKSIISAKHGIISDFDIYFRRHGQDNGIDWRLLAAIGWVESQFRSDVVSWAGARGIMQIMPRTARAHGLELENIEDPNLNIQVAANIIKTLDHILRKRVSDPDERRKFVLAAYNAGIGHILDAIALAEKYHKNPNVWNNNVQEALLMKANPQFYNDSVCRNGYFRGRQTVEYVSNVSHYYSLYCSKIKK